MKFLDVSLAHDEQVVLSDINLSIEKWSFTFMVGNSWTGKTTFLRSLAWTLRPEVWTLLDEYENDIYRYSPKALRRYKQGIATIYQDYKLVEHLTAYENIAFALDLRGADKARQDEIIESSLEKVWLAGKGHRFPRQLSWWEGQRLAVARVLALNPSLILADESTWNLDPRTSREILALFLDLNAQGTTVIFATHDFEMVRSYGKTIYRLEDGRLSEYESVRNG